LGIHPRRLAKIPPRLSAHSSHGGKTAPQNADPAETLFLAGARATVAFSPNGDSTDVIVNAINGAKQQVLVQA